MVDNASIGNNKLIGLPAVATIGSFDRGQLAPTAYDLGDGIVFVPMEVSAGDAEARVKGIVDGTETLTVSKPFHVGGRPVNEVFGKMSTGSAELPTLFDAKAIAGKVDELVERRRRAKDGIGSPH